LVPIAKEIFWGITDVWKRICVKFAFQRAARGFQRQFQKYASFSKYSNLASSDVLFARTAMFAPKIAKPQTKAAESLISKPAPSHSAPEEHRLGHDPVERVRFLQRTVGNQATLRLLRRQESCLVGREPREQDEHKADSATGTTGGVSWDFSKIPLCPPDQATAPPLGTIQPKLAIGRVDDPLEHEADAIADKVMQMPDPALALAAAPVWLTRQPASATHAANPTDRETPPIVDEVLRLPGQRLDAATRAYFEPRFGQDFSGVRVHTDAAAAHSARDVNARAYTVGQNVVFDVGQFAPGTHEGQKLLAHELAHVAQQTSLNEIQRKADLQLQRKPPRGQAGPREATVAVRWSEDGDRFYERVVAALGRSPGFREIDPNRFNYATNTELFLRTLVDEFQTQYSIIYHHHPKEGEWVKLHVFAYYNPQADFPLINKKVSFVEPPPTSKAPAPSEKKEEEHLPNAGETPEQYLRRSAHLTASLLSRDVVDADRAGWDAIRMVITHSGTEVAPALMEKYMLDPRKQYPERRTSRSVPVTEEYILNNHLWPEIEILLLHGKGEIFVEFERISGTMVFQRFQTLEEPKPGEPQPRARPRTVEEELEAYGIPDRKKIYGEIFKQTEQELKEAGITIATFGVEQLILWVAGGLLLRALGFILGGAIRAGEAGFPYLRRALSLNRKANIARAITGLGEAEAAEFTELMNAFKENKLSAGQKVRLESLMTKVETALSVDVPSLRLVGRIKDSASLVREAESLGEAAQREADDLVERYLAGNHNPGIGTKHLEGDIYYLRGRNGGRVFYRETAEGYMEVLGKADKSNEDRVIRLVLDTFNK
jgi:hypothetical protein